MIQIVRERCGNCDAFEPLSQEILEKYKDDPRVNKGDGRCSKGPFLAKPLVHPEDKCNPKKLVDGFETFVTGEPLGGLPESRWEPVKPKKKPLWR